MTPEKAPELSTCETPDIATINEVIQTQEIRTESGDRIVAIRDFNPDTNKGIYLVGENTNNVTQGVLSVENNGVTKDIEVFTKRFRNPQTAIIEQEAYRRCSQTHTPSLELLCTIPTSAGYFNITKTENYLIPYSRLKINNIEQYNEMRKNGLLALDKIHQIGIQHRDLLTRNIGVLSNKPYRSLIFDFETALIVPTNSQLSDKQKQQDRELFVESLFFQLLDQNPNNPGLVQMAKNISAHSS